MCDCDGATIPIGNMGDRGPDGDCILVQYNCAAGTTGNDIYNGGAGLEYNCTLTIPSDGDYLIMAQAQIDDPNDPDIDIASELKHELRANSVAISTCGTKYTDNIKGGAGPSIEQTYAAFGFPSTSYQGQPVTQMCKATLNEGDVIKLFLQSNIPNCKVLSVSLQLFKTT